MRDGPQWSETPWYGLAFPIRPKAAGSWPNVPTKTPSG